MEIHKRKGRKGKVLLININGMTIFKSHYLIQAGVIDGCANGAGGEQAGEEKHLTVCHPSDYLLITTEERYFNDERI